MQPRTLPRLSVAPFLSSGVENTLSRSSTLPMVYRFVSGSKHFTHWTHHSRLRNITCTPSGTLLQLESGVFFMIRTTEDHAVVRVSKVACSLLFEGDDAVRPEEHTWKNTCVCEFFCRLLDSSTCATSSLLTSTIGMFILCIEVPAGPYVAQRPRKTAETPHGANTYRCRRNSAVRCG